ncbi:formimidoylglutamase [Halpernia frigidisoli]|uniref:Arginase family protein n=1 Tax=Halpernia frigidisoli TaxID=1125876 RepID=A0A1I3I6J6_9FLAO|nr:formimidoylglutamase [Halpernia frigidisoli]SFI43634.1 Arginase family protein [Halpernia frigidisoli]
MNIEDFIIPAPEIKTENWQLGHFIKREIIENSIVLLFVSDFRGAKGSGESQDFRRVRKQLYKLSHLQLETTVCDLGDLISGKTIEDTHYVLQEFLSLCHYKNAVPVIIGGSNDLAFSLFSALNFHQKNISYTQINSKIELGNVADTLSEKNFLTKILSSKNLSVENYHHLAYQKHLNPLESVDLIKDVDFDIIRLAEMMNVTEKAEPFFRKADLVTVNCDAIESFAESFSIHPQVNGLNRREICAYMQEIGLGENLRSVGIFNFNFDAENVLNHQLLAQMIWYLILGIDLQNSHPKERFYETFHVLVKDENYTFKRDTFKNLWYFGSDDKIENCLPCSHLDYEAAKKENLTQRLLNFLNK